MLSAAWDVLLELSPWLLLGTALSGLIHVLLPRGFVHRHLSGRRGVVNAVLLGVPLPLCSCGVIPAGLGLHKDGASRGASVGFLISTPQTGVDSILVSAAFLGWPFALFKVAAAFLTGIVGGFVTDAVTKDASAVAVPTAPRPSERTFREFLDHSLQILSSIWRWLVVGILVSAAITTFLPQTWFQHLGDEPILALLTALLISVPLYVCATASVPIAAALVTAGLPSGAALVFLMAGPATNVATILAIRRGLGTKAMATYLGTILIGSVALGCAFDFVLPTTTLVSEAHAHAAPWQVASALVLLGIMTAFLLRDARSFWLRKKSLAAALEVRVDGMTCQGCANRLTRALCGAPGVHQARVELDRACAVVSGTLPRADVERIIRDAGFQPAP